MTMTLSVGAHTLRDFDVRAPGDHYFYRFDWTPQTVTVVASSPTVSAARRAPGSGGVSSVSRLARLRWTARDGAGHSVGRVDPANPRQYLIPRPSAPGKVTVRCTEADGIFAEIVIWFIRGSITVRASSSETISRDNEGWREVCAEYDLDPTTAPTLGLRILRAVGAPTVTMYCGVIEFVGTIEPPDVPCRFHFTRHRDESWIQRYYRDHRERGDAEAIAPDDDTSDAALQQQTPSYPRVTGHVFDIDAPSSTFASDAGSGEYEIYHARFHQALVIGSLPGVRAWERAMTRSAWMCDAVEWHFDAKLTVQTPGGPPMLTVNQVSLGQGPGPGRLR